jgi:hypothetical protein
MLTAQCIQWTPGFASAMKNACAPMNEDTQILFALYAARSFPGKIGTFAKLKVYVVAPRNVQASGKGESGTLAGRAVYPGVALQFKKLSASPNKNLEAVAAVAQKKICMAIM